MADVTTLLQELRRSQDRLRKEVLNGQAMILSELRSLHDFWKDQLGIGQSLPSRPLDADRDVLDVVARGADREVDSGRFGPDGLSKDVEEFTESVIKNIEGLTSVFADDLERRAKWPLQPRRAARPPGDGRTVRFAPGDGHEGVRWTSTAGGAAMEAALERRDFRKIATTSSSSKELPGSDLASRQRLRRPSQEVASDEAELF